MCAGAPPGDELGRGAPRRPTASSSCCAARSRPQDGPATVTASIGIAERRHRPERAAGTAAARRRGDVPGEAARQGPARDLRRPPARARDRAPAHRGRAAHRAGRRPLRRALPADRRSRRSSIVGFEALVRLVDEQGRAGRPGQVHRGGRAERADRADGRLGARARPAARSPRLRERRPAGRSRCRSTSPPARPPGPTSPTTVRAALDDAGLPEIALTLELTESALLEADETTLRAAGRAARQRRGHRPRRLRHRLLVADLPAPLPRLAPQGRPLVRVRDGVEPRPTTRSCAP